MNDFFSHRSTATQGFSPKFSLLIAAIFTLIATVIAGIIATSSAAHSAVPTVAIQQWSTTTALPQAVAERNVVVHQGRLYFVGGKTTSNTPSAEVYVAQIAADGSLSSWSTTTRLLVPVYLHAVAASESHLYVIGGWDGSRTRSEIWRAAFDAGGGLGAWSKVNDYPSTIDLHDAAIVGNRLYVAGGWTGTNPLDTVYYADVQSEGLGAWQ